MSLLLWRKLHHGSSAGADAYAVDGNAPEFVADFAGVLNSGTEYYRSGGSDTTFSSAFTFTRPTTATHVNSSGVLTTASSGVARRGHHVWNGSSWENAGILIEPAAATNLLLNSGTLSTQSVTVTAVAHTLHFTGTGTITLSGASTAGPLVGTGTGENNRVSLTFTPSAGSLTCTVSGTVTNAQLEVGSVPTSYIPTTGSTVTRAAETLTVAGSSLPYSATAMSFQQQGRVNFADNDTLPTVVFFDWRVVSPRVGHRLQTNGTNTGLLVGYSLAAESLNVSDDYVPGINVQYSNASRHTTSTVQIAKQGSAFTANGAATAQNVASGTLRFGENGSFASRQLIVGLFRAWGTDIGEAGIEEAST